MKCAYWQFESVASKVIGGDVTCMDLRVSAAFKEIQSIKAIDENQVTISEKWSISTLNDDNTIQHNSRQSTAFVDKWKIRMKIYQMEAIANCFIAQRFICSLLFGIAFYQKRLFTKNTLYFHEK